MTPIKKLNHNISKLREFAKNFKQITLNKAEPKYKRYNYENSYTKGVSNDVILIFELVDKHFENMSFAIAFNYINLEEKNHTAVVSIKNSKDNKDIISSQEMSIEEFRLSLNSLIKKFTAEETLTDLMIFNYISLIFLENPLNFEESVKESKEKLNLIKKENEKKFNIKELKKELEELEDLSTVTNKLLNKKIKSSKEYLLVKSLEEQLLKANLNLNKKKKEINDDLGIDELNVNLKSKKDYLIQQEKALAIQNSKDFNDLKTPLMVKKTLKIK